MNSTNQDHLDSFKPGQQRYKKHVIVATFPPTLCLNFCLEHLNVFQLENCRCQVINENYVFFCSSLPFSYLHYLDLCSRIVRASLKPEYKAAAMKRGELGLKFAKLTEGKQRDLSKIELEKI